MNLDKKRALALFSQGLDSILAIRLMQRQGFSVEAIKFISPFFGYESKGREKEYCDQVKRDYNIDLEIIDLTDQYLPMLAHPVYGYGKNFNPCLDCKLMMLTRARILAESRGIDLIVTGEVIGQRPFSQRRDTMRRLEKLSATEGLLLRPLSASRLPPVQAELDGRIERDKLYDFSGRGRKPQIRLAAELGIENYPNPAGGCLLTDPGFATRVAWLYQPCLPAGRQPEIIPTTCDINILKYGRFYPLDQKSVSYAIVGRHQQDNQKLTAAAGAEHFVLRLAQMAGPTTVLKGDFNELPAAAGYLLRHSRARSPARITWRRGSENGAISV